MVQKGGRAYVSLPLFVDLDSNYIVHVTHSICFPSSLVDLNSNLVVMLFKFGAYLYTGSGTMLSESVHSLADMLNQVSPSLDPLLYTRMIQNNVAIIFTQYLND